MKVWVVMGNDYPDAVFSSEAAAQEYCDRQKKINNKNIKDKVSRKIYWRAYDFVLDKHIPA